jgi:tRNA(Ile)-lysidine synthase
MEFKSIDEIIRLIGGHTGSPQEIQVPGGWRVICTAEELRFVTGEQRTSAADYQYELPVPGKVHVIEAEVGVETCVINGPADTDKYGSQHLLDFRFAKEKLVIRNWRAGERFWPAHTKEPKKIKELLQDRHITGQEKQRWPVIACGDEIIWLSGFGVRRDLQANDGFGVVIREIQGPNT